MKSRPCGLWIYGAGGHAHSVADVAVSIGIQHIVFADENAKVGEEFFGFPVIKRFEGPLPEGWQCFSAVGDNEGRQSRIFDIRSQKLPLATIIAPTATVGIGAKLGAGTFVGHHAHIGPMVSVGDGCIINTAAIVEHDSAVGAFSHVSVNATVAGRCSLGQRVYLGAGATIIDYCTLGDDIIIGAGSVVIREIVEQGTYVGAPARKIKSGNHRSRRNPL